MNVLYRDGVEDCWRTWILDCDFEGCLSGDWVEGLECYIRGNLHGDCKLDIVGASL